jgi:hypothetical protein
VSQSLIWVLALMLSLQCPDTSARIREMSVSDVWADWISIAEAAVEVASTEPPLFPGNKGIAKTVALILSVASHESGFVLASKGDGGRSGCLMGIMTNEGKVQEGTLQELIEDPRKCIRAGVRVLRLSMNACRSRPFNDWLGVYASGSCSKGLKQSSEMMRTTVKLWSGIHLPANDALEPSIRLAEGF